MILPWGSHVRMGRDLYKPRRSVQSRAEVGGGHTQPPAEPSSCLWLRCRGSNDPCPVLRTEGGASRSSPANHTCNENCKMTIAKCKMQIGHRPNSRKKSNARRETCWRHGGNTRMAPARGAETLLFSAGRYWARTAWVIALDFRSTIIGCLNLRVASGSSSVVVSV
jgi:hypothetical protein